MAYLIDQHQPEYYTNFKLKFKNSINTPSPLDWIVIADAGAAKSRGENNPLNELLLMLDKISRGEIIKGFKREARKKLMC